MTKEELITKILEFKATHPDYYSSLAHFSGWGEPQLEEFLADNFTPSDEMMEKLENQLEEEIRSIPRSEGHGVPRRDEDIIETLIYNAGQNRGGIKYEDAVTLLGGDNVKTEYLLEKACEDGYFHPPIPPAILNGVSTPIIYYLTQKGKEKFLHIN